MQLIYIGASTSLNVETIYVPSEIISPKINKKTKEMIKKD